MSNNIWIDKATVLPMTEPAGAKELYFEGGVGIMGDRIVAVGRDDEAKQRFVDRCGGDCRVIDGRGKLLMPGLINTHCHVAMTLMRGYADDIPLMKWLYGRIWPYESNLDRNDVRLGAELGIVEMLKGGVTAFVDMYWYEEAVADAVPDMGIRAVLSPSFSDARMAEAEIDLPATIEKAAGCDRMSVMIAPHAAYSCSPENLRRMVALRDKYGIPVTIHLAETLNEQQTIEQQFGCSPVKYIDSYGLLAEGTIAAHCVHLNDEDHEILCRRKVSVAHNPQSNMKISSGIAPVARMVEEGIRQNRRSQKTIAYFVFLGIGKPLRPFQPLQRHVSRPDGTTPSRQRLSPYPSRPAPVRLRSPYPHPSTWPNRPGWQPCRNAGTDAVFRYQA